MIDKVPSVKQLTHSPQLAILNVLQRTLELASSALVATYNDPEDHLSPLAESIDAAYAHALVTQVTALELTLSRYRRSVGDF